MSFDELKKTIGIIWQHVFKKLSFLMCSFGYN